MSVSVPDSASTSPQHFPDPSRQQRTQRAPLPTHPSSHIAHGKKRASTTDAPRDRSEVAATVVIPMYNAQHVIADQLEALAGQRFEGEWEVVVADNGSTDESIAVVRSFEPRFRSLRVVPATDRQGATHARNVGSRAARGAVILYTDADDVVTPEWVGTLVESLRTSAVAFGWRQPWEAASGRKKGFAQPPAALPVSLSFLPWGFGGNCAVRSGVFEQVGGWSEDYPHGGDDIDFCWRVQLAGHHLSYVPQAVVRYRPRDTTAGVARQRFEFGSQAPLLLRQYRRHGAVRPRMTRVLRTWGWVLTRSPYLLVSRRLRHRWVATSAGAAGRLWGSIKWRTLCL